VGLSIDEPIWDHSSFTQNRDRLIEAKVARKLLRRMVRRAKKAQLLSNQHFSVDGTLIESWAAVKSYAIRRIGVEAASRGFKVDGPTLI
jgi:transposase